MNRIKIGEMQRRDGAAPTNPTTEGRTIIGIAVPWDTVTELWPGVRESVARGAFDTDPTGIKLAWRHGEIIGPVTGLADTEAGLELTAEVAETSLGNDALALVKCGAIDRLSVGFLPITWEETDNDDGSIDIKHIKAELREVSLVPWPAYDDAVITETRSKDHQMTTTTAPITADDSTAMSEVREEMTALRQEIAALRDLTAAPATDAVERRNAAEILKAAMTGDATAITALERAAVPATSTDSPTPAAFVGDLTRIYDRADNLSGLFEISALPAEGMSIEYLELSANTVKFSEQTAEGADLESGKITLATKTAPVKTFGGAATLTRQAIERTRANLLQKTLTALASKAGAQGRASTLTTIHTGTASAASAALTVPGAVDALDLKKAISVVVDAADKFADTGRNLDGLMVDAATFKVLAMLTASDGRPIMAVNPASQAVNTAGSLNLTGLTGNVLTVPVVMVSGWDKSKAGTAVGAFYDRTAIGIWRSTVVSLQDSNVLNLTGAFSAYRYEAMAVQDKAGIIPVKFAA